MSTPKSTLLPESTPVSFFESFLQTLPFCSTDKDFLKMIPPDVTTPPIPPSLLPRR